MLVTLSQDLATVSHSDNATVTAALHVATSTLSRLLLADPRNADDASDGYSADFQPGVQSYHDLVALCTPSAMPFG